jgi:uracil-DNA glycosylase
MLTKSNIDNYDTKAVLEWYVQNGIESAWLEEPQNRLKPVVVVTAPPPQAELVKPSVTTAPLVAGSQLKEAIELAQSAENLASLKEFIQNFPHISIKSTATQIVFGDGNPSANLMVIGDAPASDDDRSGVAFAGEVGGLLDKMMNAIGRTRNGEEPATSFYVTNILNWRPPGNRTPTQFEIDLSMPFLKRHIELVSPRVILVLGNVATKALLGSGETITKLRGKWQSYKTATGITIKAMPSFHPSYLLKSPTQKKASWDDLQLVRDHLSMPQ